MDLKNEWVSYDNWEAALNSSIDPEECFLDKVKNVYDNATYLRLSGYCAPLRANLLEKAVKLIKPSVIELDLNTCCLFKETNLDKILESIPITVKTIDLSFNHLSDMSVEDLEKFSKTPSGVEHINVIYNGFKRDDEKLKVFMHALPENVRTVKLTKDELIDRAEWIEQNNSKYGMK